MSGNKPRAQSFAERLEWALVHDERSKGEIAAAAGVNPSRLSEWTGGKKVPKVDNVEALARVMATWLNAGWLLTGSGDPRISDKEAAVKLSQIRAILDAPPERGTASGASRPTEASDAVEASKVDDEVSGSSDHLGRPGEGGSP